MASLVMQEQSSSFELQQGGTAPEKKEQASNASSFNTSNIVGNESSTKKNSGVIKLYLRVLSYSTRQDTILRVIGTLAAAGSGISLPLMSIIFGGFVSSFTDFAVGSLDGSDLLKEINGLTLYFVYLFIGKFVLSYIYTTLFTYTAIRTTSALRMKFLKATLHQEISFFDSTGAGATAVRVTTNANLVNAGIAEKLGLFIQGISMSLSGIVVGLTQDWKLTLIVSTIIPAMTVVIGITVAIDSVYESRMLALYSQASSFAEEVLGSIKTVYAFSAMDDLASKFEDWLDAAKIQGFKKSKNLSVMYSWEYFIVFCGYALAFWQGVHMFANGEIVTSGTVVTVFFSVLASATAVTQTAPILGSFSQAASAAGELFDSIDCNSEIKSSDKGGETIPNLRGDIKLHNVHFSYPARPDTKVLQNVSLQIPSNKVTALVGSSGSGKSTIVGLLERWYDPLSGHLTIDNIDIRELNIKWLRSSIRLVAQEPSLFNDSVYNNILYGLTGTPLEEASETEKRALVLEASKAANAHDFIEKLSEGYDTKVGERAGLLSGGQKQRVAIARSIVSNPRILLLDEATSALDPTAEAVVQAALDRVSRFRTTIMIAHKLTTVMKADNIIVLDNGIIIEQGSHKELCRKEGAYSKLVRAQELGVSKDDKQEAIIENFVEDAELTALTQSLSSKQVLSDIVVEGEEPRIRRSLVVCLLVIIRENSDLWIWYRLVLFASIIGGGTFPAQAILFSRIMSVFELTGEDMKDRGDFFSLMFFVVALANALAYSIMGWATNVVCQTLSQRFRSEIFRLYLRQDVRFFDRPENAAAALASRLSTVPTSLQDLIGMNIALMLIVGINIISNITLALVIGWKLALVVTFGALPFIFGAGYLRLRLEMQLDERISVQFADSARFASEAVGAIRTVVSLTMEDLICSKYEERLAAIMKTTLPSTMWTMFWYSLAQSVELLAMALGFWYGGKLLSTGEYRTDQFFIVFIGVIFGGQAAGQFFAYTTSMTKAHSSCNYIFNLRNSKPKICDNSSSENISELDDDSYSIKDLRFTYPLRSHVPVLKGVSFEIQPGSSIALVGASGCGKSTLISLFERFYDPISGKICLGSKDIKSLRLESYRNSLALVSQEPNLYQGTVLENIGLGQSPRPEQAAIEQAARDANIYDFVSSLPDGFGTQCGARGTQFSGGQKQRIAIARALIRNPKILLLDEATSALDTASEKLVQDAIGNASRSRTTISVAHRLSTIRSCNCIFVFDQGRIVEMGSHTELVKFNGIYAEMCKSQALDQEG